MSTQEALERLDISVLSQIRNGAEDEVLRRLSDPDTAAEIADGQLFRLLTESVKIELARERGHTPERPQTQVNVLALIDSAKGLPADKRLEIVGRIQGEMKALEQAARELGSGQQEATRG